MDTQKNTTRLTSLTFWSHEHILRVFESTSDDHSIQAVDETFANHIVVEVNGRSAGLADIKRSIATLRKESPGGLKVEWKQSVEAPEDSSNRSGSFGGAYVMRGIRRVVPDHGQMLEFERHKSIIVRIESQSENVTIDSRRITRLIFVAADVQVNIAREEKPYFQSM